MPREVNKEEVFQYLDRLRAEGSTNMYGARPYIQEQFGTDKVQSTNLLAEWMQTFGERHSKKED